MSGLGRLLRRYREEKGDRLRKVAAYLDIDSAILSKIERGHRKATRLQVEKLADYYGVDLKEFLVAWLSDKIINELSGEAYAEEAMKLAEEQVRYFQASEVDIADIRNAVCREMKKYPSISKAWLFGSYAREESTSDSDIDLMIDVPGKRDFSLFDMFQIQHDLENGLQKKVDVVIKGSVTFNAREQSERDMILVYVKNDA